MSRFVLESKVRAATERRRKLYIGVGLGQCLAMPESLAKLVKTSLAALVLLVALLSPVTVGAQTAASPRGRWALISGGNRVFASFYTDGTYNAVREQDQRDGKVRSERELGRYTVTGDRMTLTQDPPTGGRPRNCAEPLAGSYRFAVGAEGLTLHLPKTKLLLPPARDGARPETSERAIHGCFERNGFVSGDELEASALFGEWIHRSGPDQITLGLFSGGEGMANRNRTTPDAKVQWQTGPITYSVNQGTLTLKMKSTLPCERQVFDGVFGFTRTSNQLRLSQGKRAWVFTLRPPGPSPISPAKKVLVGGCFDGDHFTAGWPIAREKKPTPTKKDDASWRAEWNARQVGHNIQMDMMNRGAAIQMQTIRPLPR